MRERIFAAVITAVIHNRRSTIAGLVAVLGLAAAKLGLQVSDDTLLFVAGFLITILCAAAGDSHQRSPRKFPRLPGGATSVMLLSLALASTLLLTACPKVQTVRSVAAGTVVACAEFKAEVAPDLTPEERAVIDPLVDEVGMAADGVRALSADWEKMGAAERRALAAFAVEQIGGAVGRLSNRGVGLKSERGRAKFARYLKWGRRAVSTLRVIEASLPPER